MALKLRELRADEVEFTLRCYHEDIPVRGNAMASGDDKLDRIVEDEIIRRLNDGDIWAWCAVIVEAKWQSFTGEDHLGGCSYASEEEFKTGGYYEDMKKNALESLNAAVQRSANTLNLLEALPAKPEWKEKERIFECLEILGSTPACPERHRIFGVVRKPDAGDWWPGREQVQVRWHAQSNSAVLPYAPLHTFSGEIYAKTVEEGIALAKAYVEDAMRAMRTFLDCEIERAKAR